MRDDSAIDGPAWQKPGVPVELPDPPSRHCKGMVVREGDDAFAHLLNAPTCVSYRLFLAGKIR